MAEKTILVCDMCGRPAVETVTIKLKRGNFVKDLCATHTNELVAGARKPRRGRRPGSTVTKTTAKRRGRPPKSAAKSGAKRRGRPPKAA
jgi:hypothetical protein